MYSSLSLYLSLSLYIYIYILTIKHGDTCCSQIGINAGEKLEAYANSTSHTWRCKCGHMRKLVTAAKASLPVDVTRPHCGRVTYRRENHIFLTLCKQATTSIKLDSLRGPSVEIGTIHREDQHGPCARMARTNREV